MTGRSRKGEVSHEPDKVQERDDRTKATMQDLESVRRRLANVEEDERLRGEDVPVQVNAPLALQQVALKTERDTLRWVLQGEADPAEKAYRDRNLLALAVVTMTELGGWTEDETDSDEYVIVWTETPMGQLSWHAPRETVEGLLPRDDRYEYDGHTREMKNDRLASWIDDGCPT